jgi:hypothetical protein
MAKEKIGLPQAGTSLTERVRGKPEALDPSVGFVPTKTLVFAD